MRLLPIVLVTAILSACHGAQGAGALSHVPLSVGTVTYQWPTDSTTDFADLGSPEHWRGVGYIPVGVWNGVMPEGLQQSGFHGQVTVGLLPARVSRWHIQTDGSGLPLLAGERFEVTEHQAGFTVGKVVGQGIVDPGVAVTFSGENEAYAQCRAPSGPNPKGTCDLLLNDRGVEHRIPLGWHNWDQGRAMLLSYRKLIGIPSATAN